MINRINPIVNQINIARPTFKSNNDEKEFFVTPPKSEADGIEALANYGIASIKFYKNFKMIPVSPIISNPNVTDDIKGDRIYSSDGKLYSIVDENEATKTVYKIKNTDESDLIDEVSVFDKESSQKIKEQLNLYDIDDFELDCIVVKENSITTGKPVRGSSYKDGELYSSTNYAKKKNGLDETVSYYYKDKQYYVYQSSPNQEISNHISLSKDLKFVNIDLSKNTKDKNISYSAEFYNGALISTTEIKTKTIPNLMGREPLSDNDLIPAKKYNISIVTPDFEGEKTYYSNGAVESIKTTDGTAYFTPDGKVTKLVSKNIEIDAIDIGSLCITEKLGEDKERITCYDEDSTLVRYIDGNTYKELLLTPKLTPKRYEEGLIEDDGEVDSKLVYYYDKAGFLNNTFQI